MELPRPGIPSPVPGCSKLIQPGLELEHWEFPSQTLEFPSQILEFPSQILEFPSRILESPFPKVLLHGTNPKFWDRQLLLILNP